MSLKKQPLMKTGVYIYIHIYSLHNKEIKHEIYGKGQDEISLRPEHGET